MEGRLLGPLEVVGTGGAATLGGLKQRAVLAQLLLRPGRTVSVDRLVDAVWGDHAGDGARHTLQVYVSTLRRELGAVEPDGAGLLERAGDGYRLALTDAQVDATLLVQLAETGRVALERGEPAAARAAFEQGLALWRGPALADFPDEHWARAEARRLEELRMAIVENRIDAELALGRHAALVGEIEGLIHDYPVRERLSSQLMLALYRSGRQADALAAYRAARRVLSEEIGVDPGPDLRALERRILAQDPTLLLLAGSSRHTDEATGTPPANLTWRDPTGTDGVLKLDPRRIRFTLGRLPGNDVALEWDLEVSRAHAEIVRFGSSWAVVDDGLSRNGTLVNGEPVSPQRLLADGDEILVGETAIVFRDPTQGSATYTKTHAHT